MVAAARALETARPDGLVHDPFAERLAGERGMEFLKGTSRLEILSFGVGLRCRFIEKLLMNLVQEQRIGRVLSLGAGLDTRPWRLDLPAGLEWIEVDFEDMLAYKEALLAGDTPRCRRERLAADLAQPDLRARIFAEADARTLVITEGLLMYLSGDVVDALVREGSRAGFWLVELVSREFWAPGGNEYLPIHRVSPGSRRGGR